MFMNLKTPKVLQIKARDFVAKDRYAEMQALYQYWFEYLKLSPSYALAKKYRLGVLTTKEKKQLPKDFADVLKTYDDFGDVHQQIFKLWWLEKGLSLMGTPTKQPTPQIITTLSANSKKNDVDELNQYIHTNWKEIGQPNTLVLAIPLNIKRSRLMKEITQILSDSISNKPIQSKAKYQLLQKKTHLNSLKVGIKVLWLRALRPEADLWRIGAEADVSKTYSKEVDPKSTKKTTLTSQARQMLTIVTSRALLNATMVAENAARGIFPSNSKHPNAMKYDANELHTILAQHTAWAKQEKAKYR